MLWACVTPKVLKGVPKDNLSLSRSWAPCSWRMSSIPRRNVFYRVVYYKVESSAILISLTPTSFRSKEKKFRTHVGVLGIEAGDLLGEFFQQSTFSLFWKTFIFPTTIVITKYFIYPTVGVNGRDVRNLDRDETLELINGVQMNHEIYLDCMNNYESRFAKASTAVSCSSLANLYDIKDLYFHFHLATTRFELHWNVLP